jgi:hypothetical protein
VTSSDGICKATAQSSPALARVMSMSQGQRVVVTLLLAPIFTYLAAASQLPGANVQWGICCWDQNHTSCM